jgi:hypothetical protein
MRCPHCGERDTRVVDSRDLDDAATIRRRRECNACTTRFTTYERVEAARLVLVKRDGTRQEWDRDKLVSGLRKALTRRPVADDAAEAAADAMTGRAGVILPFPGGVVRSGSKVGSRRIKSMIASTNDAFCPSLRAVTASQLPEGVNSVLEIVINGTDGEAISRAMRAGIDAACRDGMVAITAGNYGGKLGPHHFHLRKIMGAA